MEDKSKKQQPNKPFKQTKQLIKLALNDGWTQSDIAKTCRVSQPIVSGWKKGSGQAKLHQVQTLLEQYGHILRRKTFKLYWVMDKETQQSTYVKVEGKVIFSYIFRKSHSESINRKAKAHPIVKIVIHDQGKEGFRLILLTPSVDENSVPLSCADEDGNWIATITDSQSGIEMIQWLEKWSKKHESNLPTDAKALPFLIRKALLNHGFPVEDIVEYSASW